MRIWHLVGAVAVGAVALGAPTIVENETGVALAGCGSGYYQNSDGQCIHSPSSGGGVGGVPGDSSGLTGGPGNGNAPPQGATALCRDGDYSFSTHHSGTCSGHGGVSRWLQN